MFLLIALPIWLLASVAFGFYMAYKKEDTGSGKVYGVLFGTAGIALILLLNGLFR